MKPWAAIAPLLLLWGCGPATVLWLRVEAPLVVPDDCDAVQVGVSRADGTAAYEQSYDLTRGPSFPLTLSLQSNTDLDVGVPLTVSVAALKSGSIARPWATRAQQATLKGGELTQVLVQLCECP